MAWALSPGPLTHQEPPSSLPPWMAGGSVVEGRWADGLWAELGKDGLPPGKDNHTSWSCLGIVHFSRIPRTGKVNVGVQGELPTPHGPVSGWCQGWADRQEAWVLVFTLPPVYCVTLGKPLPLSECPSVQ